MTGPFEPCEITASVRCWDDLRAFGIEALTGEACSLAMRLLCDVTERGKGIVESFLGRRIALESGSNWNGGSKDDPHVASILLPRSILEDLGAFALCHTAEPHEGVARLDSGVVVRFTGKLRPWHRETARFYRRPAQPVATRNQHQFTGRIV